MTEEQQKELEASLALAKQLEDEEMKESAVLADATEAAKIEGEQQSEAEQEGQSISGYVNQEYAKQLMEMGFT